MDENRASIREISKIRWAKVSEKAYSLRMDCMDTIRITTVLACTGRPRMTKTVDMTPHSNACYHVNNGALVVDTYISGTCFTGKIFTVACNEFNSLPNRLLFPDII